MSSDDNVFRDYGLHPDAAAAAPARGDVRCYLTASRIIGQWLATLFVTSLAVGLCALLILLLPSPMRWTAFVTAAFTCTVGIGWMVRRSYRVMELAGDRLLIRHLYTGRTIERSVDDVERLSAVIMSSAETSNALANKWLGRFRGYDIRFRDGRTPIRITRADPVMTNAREFLEGLLQQMMRLGTLAVDVADFEGRPHVKSIIRSDRPLEALPSFNRLKYLLGALFFAVLIGPLFAFFAAEQGEKLELSRLAPHEISIRDLIRNGPGDNRHVALTDFQIDGYVVEEKNDAWTNVTLALFPDDVPLAEQNTIEAVVGLEGVRNDFDLRAKVARGRITGICKAERRKRWGQTLGPKLSLSNGGRKLESAWYIDEMNAPPSERLVQILYSVANASFAIAFLLTSWVVFRR